MAAQADFGILPPEEQRVDHSVEIQLQRLGQEIFQTLGPPQPLPAAAVPPYYASASTYSAGAGAASGHATLGGPAPGGGLGGAYTGFGFNVPENPLPSPATTLPGLSPSFQSPLDSPSPLTPPEVYGNATARWAPAVPANVPFNTSPAPGVPTTIDPRLLNAGAARSCAPPGLYNHGLPAAGGSTSNGVKFGGEVVAAHGYDSQHPPPQSLGQSLHRPSRPLHHSSVPSHAFMLPAAQYTAPRPEVVHSSSSGPSPISNARAQWAPPAPSNVPFNASPAPGVPATIDPRLLNAGAARSCAPPGLYNHGLPAAGGNTFNGVQFSGEAVAAHRFNYRYPPPSLGQSLHRPSRPLHHLSVPSRAFMPPAAQYTYTAPRPPRFVHDSSYGPSPLAISGLPALFPLTTYPARHAAVGTVATSLSPAPLPNPPPTSSVRGGHAPASNASAGGMCPPHGHTGSAHHHGGALAGPSSEAAPSVLGKRRAESMFATGPTSHAKAKAAKLSADSVASASRQQGPSSNVAEKENENKNEDDPAGAGPAPAFDPETKTTHKPIDWTNPPTWAGEPIPKMEAAAVVAHLPIAYGFSWRTLPQCQFDGCRQVFPRPGAAKSHITGKAHLDLRRECVRCGFSVRGDNFGWRHATQEKCDHIFKKKQEKELKANGGGGKR